ncbi:MAG: MFS transporter [Acidimicrobiales bacterium]
MTTADLPRLGRRYHLLLALRFVPIGLGITVLVLLMQDRGLSLAQIGVATAAQGLVMLFLELPSGGLADALGRKPVLVISVAVWMLATVIILVAQSVLLFFVAFALMGVFRALDSGPLQAWFIDASLAADPDADLERGLSHADIVICASIGAGALAGGLLASSGGIAGIDPLAAPMLVGLALQAIGLIALLRLMDEPRAGTGWASARSSLREVPTVMSGAVHIISRSRVLAALCAGELLWGFGMIAFEVFMPPRLVEVSANVEEATRVLGFAITGAWILSAVGAAAAPWLVRRYGAPVAGCGLRLLHGATVMGMAAAAGPLGLVVAYLATYGVHGATAPIHYGMVHRAVESTHRATVVSANSLSTQVGGAVSGIVLGALADATSISAAMAVAAVVLAAAGPLYLTGRQDAVTREVAPPVNVP